MKKDLLEFLCWLFRWTKPRITPKIGEQVEANISGKIGFKNDFWIPAIVVNVNGILITVIDQDTDEEWTLPVTKIKWDTCKPDPKPKHARRHKRRRNRRHRNQFL